MLRSAKFLKEFVRSEYTSCGTTMGDIVNQYPVFVGGVPKFPIMSEEKVKILIDNPDANLVMCDYRHEDVRYEYVRISPKLLDIYPVLNWIDTDNYFEDDGETPIVMEVKIHGKSVKAVYDFYKMFDRTTPVVVPWMAVPVPSEYNDIEVIREWLEVYKYELNDCISCEKLNLSDDPILHASLFSTIGCIAMHAPDCDFKSEERVRYQSVTSYTRKDSPALLHIHYRDLVADMDKSMLVTVGHQACTFGRMGSISQEGADTSMTIMEALYSPYTGVKPSMNQGN